MGRAIDRWIEIRSARRRGDSAAFWSKLMSSIGWAFVAIIAVGLLVTYLVH
jgi:hypothetical protein